VILDDRVRADLAATTRFSDIRLMKETDSTNRVVAALAEAGASEGVVVAACSGPGGWKAPATTW
jgi:hypothetical protein